MIASVFVGTSVDGFIARLNGDLDFLPEDRGETGSERCPASVCRRRHHHPRISARRAHPTSRGDARARADRRRHSALRRPGAGCAAASRRDTALPERIGTERVPHRSSMTPRRACTAPWRPTSASRRLCTSRSTSCSPWSTSGPSNPWAWQRPRLHGPRAPYRLPRSASRPRRERT